MVKSLGWLERVVRCVSLITLAALLPLKIIAVQCGWTCPLLMASALNLLVAAAVGYITNWIAIEMLFKPYEKAPWHPFSVLTFGYWQQGLVPRNKDRIGEELGKETEKRLLKPDQIASEFCALIPEMLKDKNLMESLMTGIKNLIATYRAAIATKIVTGIQGRAPQILEMAKAELCRMIRDYAREKAILNAFADELADVVVNCLDWANIERRLKSKLAEPETMTIIGEEIDSLVVACTAWVERDLVPTLEPQLLALANGPIKDKILAKLDLANRVANAVRNQDVCEFHTMINNLAAQHLVAVQVLGWVLGLVVGILQLAG